MPTADEQRVLAYQNREASTDPPPHWWLVTSWAAFLVVLLIVVGGFLWLLRLARTGDADAAAILYPASVLMAGFASVLGLVVSSIAALWVRKRQLAKATVPWLLAIASCGAVFLLYWLEPVLRRASDGH